MPPRIAFSTLAFPDATLAAAVSLGRRWGYAGIELRLIDGELIGGCDIVTELYESGELAERLGVAQPQHEPEPPTADAPQSAPLGVENRLS